MPTVTLLVCSSGRAPLLDRLLGTIASDGDLPDELVVVNGRDGETPAVMERYATVFQRVVLVVHPNRNLATLRNLGLPYCSGDVVAMTDDDAVPEHGWVAHIRSAHQEDDKTGAVGGAVRGLNDRFLSRLADAVVFPDPRPGRPMHTLPTVNMSYKRSAMREVGEFDPRLFRGEDVDYNWRLLQAGCDIRFEPEMRVRHEHRTTLRGLYQQQYMYGRAYVLVRAKWPEMYCVYPHRLNSPRAWAKALHCVLAIVYQPWGVASHLPSPSERLAAYPLLVVHHLVWKLGMLRQAAEIRMKGEPELAGTDAADITVWEKRARLPV